MTDALTTGAERLVEIKARYHSLMTTGTTLYKPDMAWLIDKVERLETENEKLKDKKTNPLTSWAYRSRPILHLPGGDKRGD